MKKVITHKQLKITNDAFINCMLKIKRPFNVIILRMVKVSSSNENPQVNIAAVKRYNCNNGSACGQLSGVFECKLGHCSNLSEVMLCHDKPDGAIVDADKDNLKLNGNFRCVNSRCTRIKSPFTCDRYCPKITTYGVNVFLMHGDNVIGASCDRALALNKANGSSPGERLAQPKEIWRKGANAMIASCFNVVKNGDKIR